MNSPKKKSPARKQRLVAVKPSGEKEGSLTDLIFDVVRQIPKGRVSTYGAIAAVLNLPNPRMVGRAMRSVDDRGRKVPAQRVINSAGRITGDHGDYRRQLLEKEGVKVVKDKVVDFKTLFWDPAKDL